MIRLVTLVLVVLLCATGAHAAKPSTRPAPKPTPKAKSPKDWTRFTSGPCPVLKGISDGTGLCAVGKTRVDRGGREAAALEARVELARLVQWTIARKANPQAPKPMDVDLVLEGTEVLRAKEARRQVYALVRLSPEGLARATGAGAP
jgi:hypothetical protein